MKPFKTEKPILHDLSFLLDDPNLTQKEILKFLRTEGIRQSKTADKQFKTTKRLTYLALIFAFISIGPIFKQLILPSQPKIDTEYLLKLEKVNLSNTNSISELTIHLFDLQNQVKILEDQNKILINKSLSK